MWWFINVGLWFLFGLFVDGKLGMGIFCWGVGGSIGIGLVIVIGGVGLVVVFMFGSCGVVVCVFFRGLFCLVVLFCFLWNSRKFIVISNSMMLLRNSSVLWFNCCFLVECSCGVVVFRFGVGLVWVVLK